MPVSLLARTQAAHVLTTRRMLEPTRAGGAGRLPPIHLPLNRVTGAVQIFQSLFWGATGFNPDASLMTTADRATRVPGGGGSSNSGNAAFNAESQVRPRRLLPAASARLLTHFLFRVSGLDSRP